MSPNLAVVTVDEKNLFLTNFRFLRTISICDQDFDFWLKFRFLAKVSIVDEIFDF